MKETDGWIKANHYSLLPVITYQKHIVQINSLFVTWIVVSITHYFYLVGDFKKDALLDDRLETVYKNLISKVMN